MRPRSAVRSGPGRAARLLLAAVTIGALTGGVLAAIVAAGPASARPAAHVQVKDAPGGPIPFGTARNYGDAPTGLRAPVVAMATGLSTEGYWLAASDGGIFAFGDAAFHGSMGGTRLNSPIVGMAAAPDGRGYWLVAADGGIFSFGTARFHGSMGGRRLYRPIVGMAATPDGGGYWLAASDGGIFAFGDARFFGSMGGRYLNAPIVGMAAAPAPGGYWLVARDGGIFSYGSAHFFGSAGSVRLVKPVVGMAARPDDAGYWLAASDGGVFSYGAARYEGSAAGSANPIAAIAASDGGPGYWLLPTSPPPPPPAPALPPGFVAGRTTAIGDSVMLDVEPNLQADIPGVDVEAVVSRQWDQGVALAAQLKAQDALGATVIVDLGTNGPVSLTQFQQMMAVLAGARRVVFVTVHLPPSYSWSQSVNATLRAGVPMYANARLADFNALADQHPEWFGSDGVHMPIGGAGAAAMAALIVNVIHGP